MTPTTEVVLSLDAPFRDAVEIQRIRFGQPGNGVHVAIVAGLHGNEVGGVCAVNQLVNKLKIANGTGCIDVYPVVNRMGLDESNKVNPLDHRDINRWFPGNANGSASERIANAIFSQTESCDWVVSVHTGAAHIHDIVQVRCLKETVSLCESLGAPLVWSKPKLARDVSFLGQAIQRGQGALYLSGGVGNQYQAETIDSLQQILWRWLHAVHAVQDVVAPASTATIFEGKMHEVRTPTGGIFIPMTTVGERVQKGQALGRVEQVVGGEVLNVLNAPFDCLITSVRVQPVVYPYELLIRLVPSV